MNKEENNKIFWISILIPLGAVIFLIVGNLVLNTFPELFANEVLYSDGENCCKIIGFGDMEEVSGGLLIVYETDCGEIIKKEIRYVYEVGDVVCRP